MLKPGQLQQLRSVTATQNSLKTASLTDFGLRQVSATSLNVLDQFGFTFLVELYLLVIVLEAWARAQAFIRFTAVRR